MTRPDPNYRNRRRELERELADLPTPPPPADLLDRIRDEIPASLAGTAESPPAARSWHSTPLVRLAASLAVVAAGLAIATRVVERPEAGSFESRGVRSETPGIPDDAIVGRHDERTTEGRTSPARPTAEASAVAGAPAVVPPSPDSLSSRQSNAAGPGPAARERSIDSAEAGASVIAVAPLTTLSEADRERFDSRREDLRGRLENLQRLPSSQLRAEGEALLSAPSAEAVGDRPRTPQSETRVEEQVAADRKSAGRSRQVAPERSQERRRIAVDALVAAPSTGGTAEPNDAAFGDMFFRGAGTNPFVDTAEDRLSTFALDVDTGSWTLARSYLERGSLPPAEAIRVEEFVNAQSYGDPAPRRGDFTLVAEGAPSPFAPRGDYRLLRFAVKAREIHELDRKPAMLTFVVDVSGSMNRENRLGLVQRALGLLLDELRPDDRVALVVYGTRGRVLLRPTHDHEAIRHAIARLRPEGSTNAEEGLRLGYDLADQGFGSGLVNRVILCSDGVANVGATGPESILERIGREARRGIELTTVGFGMGNYNDALMEQLADQGDGRYHYVDTLDEARRIFVENLTGTLQTIARDAKIQVEFDPRHVERWRLIGYENRDVADRDFRNDRVDAGEIGSGHSVVALYEVRLAPRARRSDNLGTLRLRWQSVATGRVEEASLTLRERALDRSFESASPELRKAAVAAELAEMLKGSYYAREASWSQLAHEADRLERDARRDPQLSDLVDLVHRAARLAGPGFESEEYPRDELHQR